MVAVDIAREKVAMINRGQSPIVENDISRLIESGIQAGRLRGTDDPVEAVAATDISFISVGVAEQARW